MATEEDMERLRAGLTTEGHYVEIDRYFGHASGSAQAATDSARDAAAKNQRGEHVARVIDSARVHLGTGRRFECGVDVEQARELLAAGARYLGPEATRP